MNNTSAYGTVLVKAANSSFRFFASTDQRSLHRYHESGAFLSLPEEVFLEDVHRPLDELLRGWLLVGDGIAACDSDPAAFESVRDGMRRDPRFNSTNEEREKDDCELEFRRIVKMTSAGRRANWTTINREDGTGFGSFSIP